MLRAVEQNGSPGSTLESGSERGNVVILSLVMIMIMAALALAFLVEGLGEIRSETANRMEIALLGEAENALHYNFQLLELDPVHAIRAGYGYDAGTSMYTGPEQAFSAGTGTSTGIQFSFQYRKSGAPVVFANPNDPSETFDEVRVFATARRGWVSRQVVKTRTTVLARGVSQFSVTENNDEIVINLSIDTRTSNGRNLTKSTSLRILIRN